MADKYNVPTSGTTVDRATEHAFLDALSACVVLTPAEEERIMPSRVPTDEDKAEAAKDAEIADKNAETWTETDPDLDADNF